MQMNELEDDWRLKSRLRACGLCGGTPIGAGLPASRPAQYPPHLVHLHQPPAAYKARLPRPLLQDRALILRRCGPRLAQGSGGQHRPMRITQRFAGQRDHIRLT